MERRLFCESSQKAKARFLRFRMASWAIPRVLLLWLHTTIAQELREDAPLTPVPTWSFCCCTLWV